MTTLAWWPARVQVEMNQRMEKRDKMRREMALVEGGDQADAG